MPQLRLRSRGAKVNSANCNFCACSCLLLLKGSCVLSFSFAFAAATGGSGVPGVLLSVGLGSCAAIAVDARLAPAVSFDVAFLATIVAAEVFVRRVLVSGLLLFAFALGTAVVLALAFALSFQLSNTPTSIGSSGLASLGLATCPPFGAV